MWCLKVKCWCFGCFSQGQETPMWGVNGAPMGRSLTQFHLLTTVSLTQSEWRIITFILSCLELRSLTSVSLFLCSCYGRVVVKKGDATSDTMCEPPNANTQSQTSTKNPPTEMLFTTATEVMSTLLVTSETTRGPPDSTLSLSPSASGDVFIYSTNPPPTSSAPDSTLGTATNWFNVSNEVMLRKLWGLIIGLSFPLLPMCCLCVRLYGTCGPRRCYWITCFHRYHSSVSL